MTEFSGAADITSDFDGSTLSLEVEDRRYLQISGLETTEFETNDKVIDCISLMCKYMVPYAIILGEKPTYFLYHRYKIIENDKNEAATLLNATNGSLDPYVQHVENCGVYCFKRSERSQIHTSWPGHGEDIKNEDDISDVEYGVEEDGDLIETSYTNGNNEVVKIFNQKCVVCLERYSICAFRQCGHQCLCEQCYRNKGDIVILKCVICRT